MSSSKKKKVFVAMSGGVDSSVAAGLLQESGYEVVGVTMCFNISHPETRRPSCCGVEGINDAKRAAGILGIPHYVLNFAEDIDHFIIENFVQEYVAGRTPNPCVRCNQFLKFGTLFNKVRALGADYLATGHYVRLVDNRRRKCFELSKAKDSRKDQAYFLYGTPVEILRHLLFPLGDLKKDTVRALARKYRLNTAEKPESQDICFVPDRDYKKFIRQRLGEEVFVPGPFKNPEGEVIGEHQGILNYTIGQRERLGLALGYPVYVYRIDRGANTIYVGTEEFLYADGFWAGQLNWLVGEKRFDGQEVMAQIRYNALAVKARVNLAKNHRVRVDFVEPQKAVTPGQSVVFYDRDVVLGGGIIEEAITASVIPKVS